MRFHPIIAAFAVFMTAFPMAAQVNKSNLTGVVKDKTGAAVPGVSIKLTNTATGVTRTETADSAGFYRVSLIDFGRYRLVAEAPGFKRFVQDGVELTTGETTTVEIVLEVGEASESVTVTAESPLLRTESATNGTTVNTQVLNELPLIGRNPYVFLTLSPGIQYTGDPGALNPWDVFGPANFASSGAEARSEFLLDGIPNMRIDVVSLSPSPDAVQEMRVQTNAYDAEYGHSGAAFVNVSTRGGTNTEHGTVYWFLRNDNLNANNFFNNRSGQNKSEFKQNTYGASLGGPVRIPKIYRGVDRTHYFFNFEGTQIRGAAFARAVVPTEPERRGDFSQTRDVQGRSITIYDPATTTAQAGGYVRSPFPGNIIPTSRFDPVSANALKYYPIPNQAPTATNRENFLNSQISGRKWASLAARTDHQISPTHTLFFRYGWNHRLDPSSAFYGDCCRPAGNPTSGQDEFERGNIGAAAGYTWVKSARTVIDFRMGFTRYFEANIMYGEGFDISKLGFPAQLAQQLAFSTFPRFEMNGDLENLGAGRTTSRVLINQYNPLVNFHHTFNRHAVKYGFRYQVGQQNSFGPNRAGGYYKFTRVFTQGPDPTRTSVTAGYDFASFLLGAPASGYVDINANPALENKYYSFYFQDDWKVSQRLTLNLGLRFEHEGATTDRFNRGIAGFDTTVESPVARQAQANYAANPIPELRALPGNGGVRFLAVDKTPSGHLNMPALIYSPRIGYAYRLTDWMVARGGWGIYYVPNVISNYRLDGFSLATQMVTSLDGNLTPFNTLSNAFPSGLVQPPGARLGLLTAVGQSLTANISTPGNYLPNFLHGLTQQYSQGFQIVLPKQISIEASYAGNHSQRLTINSRDANVYPNSALPLKTRLNAQVANPYFGVISDPTSALSQRTTSVAQLLRPYPQFVNVTYANLPFGRSRYDSFQFQLSKRMANGLYFGVAYTLSKLIEATSYLNSNDAKPEKVISDSDRPQRLVLHGLYEFPFGPGKKLLNSTNPVLRRVAGGWQMNWVVTYQRGAPLEFGGSGADRLRVSDSNPYTVDQWFDRSQFAPREPFTLRTMSTRLADIRIAGIQKWDLTVQKEVRITERVNFKFVTEFYNAFNHTHFGTPNTTVTSTSFGRITGTFLGPRELQMSARIIF